MGSLLTGRPLARYAELKKAQVDELLSALPCAHDFQPVAFVSPAEMGLRACVHCGMKHVPLVVDLSQQYDRFDPERARLFLKEKRLNA
jgi:hypothetical protein